MDIESLVLSKKYTDAQIAALPKPFIYKGSVASFSNLPTPSESNKGWVYTTLDTGHEYVSDGTQWIDLSNPDVTPNAPLSGGEPELFSLKVGNTTYNNLNYHPFPDSFDTTHTLQQFGQSIVNYENFATGCTWFGGIECTDLPNGLMQVECKVTALRDTTDFARNIAMVEIFSSNRQPFYWMYNTDSWNEGTGKDDWKYVVSIDGSQIASMAANETGTVKCRKLSTGGLEFYIVKD